MGGINPNPPDDDGDRPKTRAEADARNVIGRDNRARVGLGSSYGESAIYEQQVQQQALQDRATDQRQQAIQQDQQTDYETQALEAARRRPGFTALGNLGDRSTQRFGQATDQLNKTLSLMGMPAIDTTALTGVFLESQRQHALTTPGTRDDQFFAGELSKWAQNKIELSSSFHYVTRDAIGVKENPYEIAGDASVEFLKGSPNKRSERFSPISGQMSRYLPGDRGLQETMWDTARTNKAQPGSYMDAIQVISSSRGGLVTGRMGSPNRTTINTPIDSSGRQNLPAPFLSYPPGRPAGTLEKLNAGIGGALGIRASAMEQGTPAAGATGAGMLPGILGFYEKMNELAAPFTTDISGMGRLLKKTPDIENMGIVGDVLNFAKGAYVGASQHPYDIAVTFAAGSALGIGEGLAKTGVAKAATSGIPGLSTAGRALSSPVAGDIARIGKFGIGAFFVTQAGVHIASQPTATGKGEAAGRTAIQFAGFGAGASNVRMPEPDNPYAGRGFFSNKQEIGPIEKIQFKIETAARSLTTSQPRAYREVSEITLPGRTVEPVRKAEPDFSILSKSGAYAKEIKSTLQEQPHSVIGSSSVRQQYPPGVAESTGLRIGKDVDALVESPSKAITRLSRLTGMPESEAGGVLDVHPIPRNYPGFKPSVEVDMSKPESSILTRAFGDPYRNIAKPRGTSEVISPGKGYTGDLTYEAAQVQFGRKAAAVSLVIEKPIQTGYRAPKDIYDFVTLYRAQRQIAIATGTPSSKFSASDRAMTSFMNREFTFGTVKGQRAGDSNPVVTRTARDIFNTLYSETTINRAAIRTGAGIPGNVELTFGSSTPSQGIAASLIRSAPPSILFRNSGSGSSSQPSSPRSPSSPPGSSPARSSPPSSPGSRIFISVPPSTPPRSPRSVTFTPPGSPPVSPTTASPPGSTPRSPPSRVPPTPTIVPPSTPPIRSPPRSPPSSPPEYPTIIPEPPRRPPGLLLSDAPGNTNRLFAPRGSYGWSRLNPTTDFNYLAKGMPMPTLPGSRKKKRKGPFR